MARVILLLGFGVAFVATVIQGRSVPVELQEAATPIREACIEQTGATVEMLEKASVGDFPQDDKCYFKCVFEKFKVLDGDNINFDAVLQILPEPLKESGAKTIAKCRDATGPNLCDKIFNFTKCFQKMDPEKFFVI